MTVNTEENTLSITKTCMKEFAMGLAMAILERKVKIIQNLQSQIKLNHGRDGNNKPLGDKHVSQKNHLSMEPKQ